MPTRIVCRDLDAHDYTRRDTNQYNVARFGAVDRITKQYSTARFGHESVQDSKMQAITNQYSTARFGRESEEKWRHRPDCEAV